MEAFEKTIITQRDFVYGKPIESIEDLRAIYNNLKQENPNVKDYESWLKALPHKDVEQTARQKINQDSSHLVIARNVKNKRERLLNGFLPFDILSNHGVNNENKTGERSLIIGDDQAILVLTGNPKGVRAEDGFDDVNHRMVWGGSFANADLRQFFMDNPILFDDLEIAYSVGAYREGMSKFLNVLNDHVKKYPVVLV